MMMKKRRATTVALVPLFIVRGLALALVLLLFYIDYYIISC